MTTFCNIIIGHGRTPTGVGGQHSNVVDSCKLEIGIGVKDLFTAPFREANYMVGTSNDINVIHRFATFPPSERQERRSGQLSSHVVDLRQRPYRDGLTSSVPTPRSRSSRRPFSACGFRRINNEAALSAQRAQAGKEAWFPFAYEHSCRSSRHPVSTSEGPRSAVGVIGRLSGRSAFARLRAEGTKAGKGPIRVISRCEGHRASSTSPARIAFAIPRSVGNAVVRNRTKRRLTAALRDLSNDHDQGLPAGDHLIRVTASIDHWSYSTLRTTMHALLCEPTSSGTDRNG